MHGYCIASHAVFAYQLVARLIKFTFQESEGTSTDEEAEEEPNVTEELPELPSGQFYVERLVAKRIKVYA